MHPDLEPFLENSFRSVEQTSPEIGRVVVEPDYEASPESKDAGQLASELSQCLREAGFDNTALNAHEGYEVGIPSGYRLLRKYIRRIVLHADSVEGEWIEVAPPGNWI